MGGPTSQAVFPEWPMGTSHIWEKHKKGCATPMCRGQHTESAEVAMTSICCQKILILKGLRDRRHRTNRAPRPCIAGKGSPDQSIGHQDNHAARKNPSPWRRCKTEAQQKRRDEQPGNSVHRDKRATSKDETERYIRGNSSSA